MCHIYFPFYLQWGRYLVSEFIMDISQVHKSLTSVRCFQLIIVALRVFVAWDMEVILAFNCTCPKVHFKDSLLKFTDPLLICLFSKDGYSFSDSQRVNFWRIDLCSKWWFSTYSRIPNKHRPTLINFWEIFQGVILEPTLININQIFSAWISKNLWS